VIPTPAVDKKGTWTIEVFTILKAELVFIRKTIGQFVFNIYKS